MSLENKLNKNKIETKNDEPKEISLEEFNAEIEEKISIANDSNTPPETLAELGKDTSEQDEIPLDELYVANSKSTPPEILAELSKDPDEWVSEAARENLKNRKKEAA